MEVSTRADPAMRGRKGRDVTSSDTTDTGGHVGEDQPRPELPQSKEEVRARREELRVALVDLEDALTSPAGDHEHWVRRVEGGVRRMLETLRDHVEDTEAEEGMLAQIDEDAPWLDGRVEQLRGEHAALLERSQALLARCQEGAAEDVRDEALELLQAVSRHRQRGTDLLWDAYMVDISAAD